MKRTEAVAAQNCFPMERGRAMSRIMTIHQPVISLVAGILIFIMPRLLNYVVAIYLIVIGILGLIR